MLFSLGRELPVSKGVGNIFCSFQKMKFQVLVLVFGVVAFSNVALGTDVNGKTTAHTLPP